eukprot:TRINITY_DN7689_c0_g1_i3.p2 TRINITY_DN7689_c0_g1~~TRINITY_DN7689_c0_g1_i3.p2  ORF type:complete len:142 (+),score=16.35 TRINITY_DN7689_c0_g1_i3:1-426(+)
MCISVIPHTFVVNTCVKVRIHFDMQWFFFFKQKTAYEMLRSLVGSEMCIRDRSLPQYSFNNLLFFHSQIIFLPSSLQNIPFPFNFSFLNKPQTFSPFVKYRIPLPSLKSLQNAPSYFTQPSYSKSKSLQSNDPQILSLIHI